MKIIFASTPTAKDLSQILTDMQVTNRLLSYYYLQKMPGYLAYHVETGLNPPTKQRKRKRATWGDKSYEKQRVLALIRRNRMYETAPPDTE